MRKRDCTCYSHHTKYGRYSQKYKWCVDVGLGDYCESCSNRFFCYTQRGWLTAKEADDDEDEYEDDDEDDGVEWILQKPKGA